MQTLRKVEALCLPNSAFLPVGPGFSWSAGQLSRGFADAVLVVKSERHLYPPIWNTSRSKSNIESTRL